MLFLARGAVVGLASAQTEFLHFGAAGLAWFVLHVWTHGWNVSALSAVEVLELGFAVRLDSCLNHGLNGVVEAVSFFFGEACGSALRMNARAEEYVLKCAVAQPHDDCVFADEDIFDVDALFGELL